MSGSHTSRADSIHPLNAVGVWYNIRGIRDRDSHLSTLLDNFMFGDVVEVETEGTLKGFVLPRHSFLSTRPVSSTRKIVSQKKFFLWVSVFICTIGTRNSFFVLSVCLSVFFLDRKNFEGVKVWECDFQLSIKTEEALHPPPTTLSPLEFDRV